MNFSPVVNPLIEILATLLTGVASIAAAVVAGSVGVISIYLINMIRKWLKLRQIEIDVALQAKIDAGAQRYIGGLVAEANLPIGKIDIEKSKELITNAAGKFAAAYADTFKAIGIDGNDLHEKAKDVLLNRIGLSITNAAGAPISNPSAPTPQPAVPDRKATKP